jgi:histidinol phosphatase-like PHP family hydrolase
MVVIGAHTRKRNACGRCNLRLLGRKIHLTLGIAVKAMTRVGEIFAYPGRASFITWRNRQEIVSWFNPRARDGAAFTFGGRFRYLFRVIDLHTHTLFSDGELLPFELARRAEAKGLRAIAITDHVDSSNIDFVVPRILKAVKVLRETVEIDVIAGAELTHVPPVLIGELVAEARSLGAELVLVHGETLVEPVLPGTNRAAIEAGCDILSHPGLITGEEARLAAEKGVALEISARKGHCLSNGHVATKALKHGAKLVVSTDAHSPADLITREEAVKVLLGTGLDAASVDAVFAAAQEIVKKIRGG